MGTAEKEKKNVAKGFQPLGERVFVTYTEELDRTAGGIYVPDSAKEKPQRGVVQAVGKKVENVKIGDQVLFDKRYRRADLPFQRNASGGQGCHRVWRDRPRIRFQQFNRKSA